MSIVQAFNYQNQPVRTITMDGQPGFIANDLCAVLEIRNPRDTVAGLDDDEKGVATTDTLGGAQQMAFVTEAGMYSLVLRSRKPEAKMFKRWITHDVLPQIRKTGAYATPTLSGPELMAKALLEAAETIKASDRRVLELTPKAEAFDSFLSTSGDYSVNEAAKILARDHSIMTGEKRLRSKLEEWGWIYRQSGVPRAKQVQIENGRMTEKASFYFHPETGEKVAKEPQVRITPKGLAAIRDKWMAVAA